MSKPDVSSGDMPTPPLDANTADRLLAGAIQPDDAPNGYQRIAALIAVASESPTEAEIQTPPAGLAELVTSSSEPVGQVRRTRRRSTKVAVAATVLCLTASSAAAATNHLPAPVQRAVSSVASQIGVAIPKPVSSTDTTPEPMSPDQGIPVPTPGSALDQTPPEPVDLLPTDPVPAVVDEVVPDHIVPGPIAPQIPNGSCTPAEILSGSTDCPSSQLPFAQAPAVGDDNMPPPTSGNQGVPSDTTGAPATGPLASPNGPGAIP
jgi:hypothetical protein